MNDVTSYVEEHAGCDAILAHAGDDSTQGFNEFYGFYDDAILAHVASFC